jgi:hypothetical protein
LNIVPGETIPDAFCITLRAAGCNPGTSAFRRRLKG